METKYGDPFVISPTKAHNSTVIFIHGLGQTYSQWVDLLKDSINPALDFPQTKWIFPQAPNREVTFSGFPRPAWFDLHALPPSDSERNCPPSYVQEQIISAIDHISTLIDAEIEKVNGRVILAGFSQGSVIAIQTALRGKGNIKVQGIAVLSGWMHDVVRLSEHLSHTRTEDGRGGGDAVAEEARSGVGTDRFRSAIFWGHGTADEEIPLSLGRDGVGWLQEVNKYVQVDFREYGGMGHMTCEAEMRDWKAWLSHLLNS